MTNLHTGLHARDSEASTNSEKNIWMFPKIGMEHPIKMDDLGVPLFLETPIYNF